MATGQFNTPYLDVRDVDGTHFRLLAPLRYVSIAGDVYLAEIGFVTDFASVPRLAWWIFPKTGKYDRAAVLHDKLYVTGQLTRRETDGLFLEAMHVCQVSWFVRHTMHAFVRIGGWWAWHKYRRTHTGA